ncbi:hypothetical protein PTKIN_Ptkin05aG0020000 [Pterospermum kingtungense]
MESSRNTIHGTVDLRYIILLPLNLFFSSFPITSPDRFWDQLVTALEHGQKHVLAFLILFLLFLLFFFLCTPIELPLGFGPIRLRPTFYSAPLTVLLLLSVFSPPTLFWPPCLFLGTISRYHGKMFELLRRSLCWCSLTLQSFPTLFIVITHNQEIPEPPPIQPVEHVEILIDPMEYSTAGIYAHSESN